jgi:hypothetical protein
MTAHTPGPWTCHTGSVYKDGPTVYPKGQDEGIPICHMDREPGNGTMPVERDANARLIAAAPDLLAALEAAEQKMYALGREFSGPRFTDRYDDGPTLLKLCEQANAAIARAKGEK